jgi:hypothetical protein
MTNAPGTEDAAYLAFTLLDDLLKLLVRKGVITNAECVALLDEAANNGSKQTRAIAKRTAGFIRDTMIPEHNVKE